MFYNNGEYFETLKKPSEINKSFKALIQTEDDCVLFNDFTVFNHSTKLFYKLSTTIEINNDEGGPYIVGNLISITSFYLNYSQIIDIKNNKRWHIDIWPKRYLGNDIYLSVDRNDLTCDIFNSKSGKTSNCENKSKSYFSESEFSKIFYDENSNTLIKTNLGFHEFLNSLHFLNSVFSFRSQNTISVDNLYLVFNNSNLSKCDLTTKQCEDIITGNAFLNYHLKDKILDFSKLNEDQHLEFYQYNIEKKSLEKLEFEEEFINIGVL